jgi:hypothetical protein
MTMAQWLRDRQFVLLVSAFRAHPRLGILHSHGPPSAAW